MHKTQFTSLSTPTDNPAAGSVTPAELGDKGIQQLQEKVFEWKECVQRDRKEQEDKSRAVAMEAKKSHGKSKEISKLTSDLHQAVQEKEVRQIIILFVHIVHALSYCHAYTYNGCWLVCNCFAHWQTMKNELEEMEKMLLTKKEEVSFQNTQIYELRSIVRMWYIKLHSVQCLK